MDDMALVEKILGDVPADTVHTWQRECSDAQSVPMSMLLAREVWKSVIEPEKTSWLDETIASLQPAEDSSDLYSMMYPKANPELLTACENIKNSDIDKKALSLVVREAQKTVLYSVLSLLDGGHCFDDGLESNWGLFELDEDVEPARPLMTLCDVVDDFDPALEMEN